MALLTNNISDPEPIDQPLNGRQDVIAKFWGSEKSSTYEQMAGEGRPDNMMAYVSAYSMIASHLSETNQHPFGIDIGCFKGDSTERAIRYISGLLELDYKYLPVVGIDSQLNFIKDAVYNYRNRQDLQVSFQHVASDEDLPNDLKSKANFATMFFVDQVIPNNRILIKTLKKAYDSLSEGGVLAILRLTKSSFDPKLNFALYKHNRHDQTKTSKIHLKQIGNEVSPQSKMYIPTPFMNELCIPKYDLDGEVIRGEEGMEIQTINFVDYMRESRFIEACLSSVSGHNGFSQIKTYPLSLGMLVDDEMSSAGKIAFENSYNTSLQKFPELQSSSDGNHPLHEVIIAIK